MSRVDILLASSKVLPALDLPGERLRYRVESLSNRGGGLLLSPTGEDGPLLVPGVRHVQVPVPPGAHFQQRQAATADELKVELARLRPRLVHCFGVHLAVPALLHAWTGCTVVLEPGITTAQRLRNDDPTLPAERLSDLVALEDRCLSRAHAVVAHSPLEAATLVKRGVQPAKVWTIRDGPMPGLDGRGIPDLPNLVFVGDLGESSGADDLVIALSRLENPWRATFVTGDGPRGKLEHLARKRGIDGRITVARIDHETPERIAAARLVVVPTRAGRGLTSGAWLPQGVLWAVGGARPLVAPDLPAIRAYAGSSARYFPPGDIGALAAAIDGLLGDPGAVSRLADEAALWQQGITWRDADTAVQSLWTDLLSPW